MLIIVVYISVDKSITVSVNKWHLFQLTSYWAHIVSTIICGTSFVTNTMMH